jgi:hypothetical protein
LTINAPQMEHFYFYVLSCIATIKLPLRRTLVLNESLQQVTTEFTDYSTDYSVLSVQYNLWNLW